MCVGDGAEDCVSGGWESRGVQLGCCWDCEDKVGREDGGEEGEERNNADGWKTHF